MAADRPAAASRDAAPSPGRSRSDASAPSSRTCRCRSTWRSAAGSTPQPTRYYSGRPAALQQQLRRGRRPDARQPDATIAGSTRASSTTQDSFTPRSNAWFYDGLNGPSAFVTDMTLTKIFNLTSKYRIEARIEAYNALQQHRLGQPRRRSRERELRQGHAETDRRGRAGDTDRRKIRVLIERCLRKTATSRATRSTGSAPSCAVRRFARWSQPGRSARRARRTRSNEP